MREERESRTHLGVGHEGCWLKHCAATPRVWKDETVLVSNPARGSAATAVGMII